MWPPVALLLLGTVTVPGAGAGGCSRSEFRCGDGTCVPSAWVCDGRPECGDGSDETPDTCRSLSCSPGELSCGGRRSRCVPVSWRCDGHRDCDNGSDERDCPPRSCPPDQLPCGGGGGVSGGLPLCVSRAFACDGERDCPDGADEAGCPPPPRCDPHQFRCRGGDGRCLPLLWACDGDPDCPDGSDEGPEFCGPPRTPPAAAAAAAAPPPCPPLRFPCGSGECVPRRWRCDGGRDCRDGSDEEGCAALTCRPDQFRCGDGGCVLGVRQCDGEPDCADGSDEEGCHNVTACDQFRCRSGECVPRERVCDGRRDCRDWSDEPIKECGVNECLDGNGGCSHVCRDLPLGYECLCPGGFGLGPDGRTCQDIDECRDPQTCSQLCLNLPGSYKCECGGGYRLDPHTQACRALGPPPSLLFTTRHEIRRLGLGGGGYGRVLGALKHVGALDAEVATGTVFWADLAQRRIVRSPLSGGGDQAAVPVVGTGLVSPGGLALDWVHQNLYWSDWSDGGVGTLSVVHVASGRHRTLLRERGARPRAIAIDPLRGYMYWTDWGGRPKIAKGGLNGADQFPLVTEGLEWPNGIALDLPSQRLYWVDSGLRTLSSSDLDGGRRRTLLTDPPLTGHPFALAVFEDTVFWSEVGSGAILSAGRRGGDAAVTRVAQDLFSPEAMVLLHPLRQPPAPDRCWGSGCSFLCLPAPHVAPGSPRFTCACPDGQRPAPDGRGCLTDPSAPTPTDAAPDTPTAPPETPTPHWDPQSRGVPPSPTPPSNSTTSNTTGDTGDAVGRVGRGTGVTALAVVLPLVLLLLLGAFVARGLWRGWRRRSSNSISFHNPLYQKPPPEDQQPLGRGVGDPAALTLDDSVA